jgi:hypothetical protein
MYEKGFGFSMAKEAVDSLISEEILPTTSFILGNINDDKNKTFKTIEVSRELEYSGAISIFTLLVPVPGTKMHQTVREKNVLRSKDLRLYNGTRALLGYHGITGDELEEIFFESYKNSILNDHFLKRVGRTNFNLGNTSDVDTHTLFEGFEKEKRRMQKLGEMGYLDDEPRKMAVSCEWVFDNY